MKRKIKVWGKLRLYEASAVGIPAYPDAHANASSFSLIKSLSNISLRRKTDFVEETEDMGDELNLMEEKETMVEEEMKDIPKTEDKATEDKATEDKATEDKATEDKATEDKATEDVKEEKKTDVSEMIAKAVKEGIKELIEAERGLVVQQPIKTKSLGEMAIEQGLFRFK